MAGAGVVVTAVGTAVGMAGTGDMEGTSNGLAILGAAVVAHSRFAPVGVLGLAHPLG